jgi:hypothetical protein
LSRAWFPSDHRDSAKTCFIFWNYLLGSEGGTLSDQQGGLIVYGAEERNAAAGLVLVEEAGKFEARDVGFYSGSDIGGRRRCHGGQLCADETPED